MVLERPAGTPAESAEQLLTALFASHPRHHKTFIAFLEPVLAHDRRRNGKLLRTLEILSQNNFSMSAAAQKLEVHRHTVEYRIRRVEQILNISTRNTSERLLLEMAIFARKIRRR